ncbi:MAG: porphobilinogen synthase [Mycolicibacterium sp.]|uniref:porphobilinogen synthase n=1 Tax=Mycolicibacterium sp. TaxID=2320850 RepID=UPI003D0F8655
MSITYPPRDFRTAGATVHRPRRLRRTPALRRLAAEVHLTPAALVQPIFVRDGIDRPREIPSMPGVFQHTVESAAQAAATATAVGVGGIMIFGVPAAKDEMGTEAADPDGIMQRALRAVVREVGDDTVIMADINLDEYTTHGHSGVLDASGDVDNDLSVIKFAEVAVAQANAGAHVVAPSGMMDGQIRSIRCCLDTAGHQSVAVLAYAVKYASAFYGPFRDAVESSLVGNRRTYQQYPGNVREAIREVQLDIDEGADIVMVKPALPYLDIVSKVAELTNLPVAAYQTSGEYAMIEAAAAQGMLNRESAIRESLLSIRRAGATTILTYWATEAAAMILQGDDY